MLSPESARRNTATIGKPRLRNWFQRLVSVIARVMSRVGKRQPRSTPYEPATPAATPAGTTIESAVDAWVTICACMNDRPGSATIQGGANVARLIAVASSSRPISGQVSCFTTPQTWP